MMTLPPIHINNSNGICTIEQQEFSAIGFGTAHMKRSPDLCFKSVEKAAKFGYRIIDTATRYENFDPLRDALKEFDRSEFYIISKVWHDKQKPQDLQEDLSMALNKLNVSYIDAYFLHWPNSSVPIEETLKAMDQLRHNRLIRHIGLSNVTVNHLKRALEVGVPIVWVQMEMSPFFYDPELLAYCQDHSIGVQASAPLHESGVDQDTYLSELGKRYGKTPAQIALRWILQHNCIPLPRSSNPEHMQQNRDIFDFTLSQDEMDEIDEKAKNGTRTVKVRGEAVIALGFEDEFDFSPEQCWPKILED